VDQAEVKAAQVEALGEAGPVPFGFPGSLGDGTGFFCGAPEPIFSGATGVSDAGLSTGGIAWLSVAELTGHLL
jgi:hypothetical protein